MYIYILFYSSPSNFVAVRFLSFEKIYSEMYMCVYLLSHCTFFKKKKSGMFGGFY